MADRVSRPERPLLAVPVARVVVAAGAMGTMPQAKDVSLDGVAGGEGRNGTVNTARPDTLRDDRDAVESGAGSG